MHYLEALKTYNPQNEQEANELKVILEMADQYGDHLLDRECQVAHLTSSGLILNKNLDKVLLVHHNIYNTWAWTGGHADGDKDMLEVALKEGKEETGVKTLIALSPDIAAVDILPVYGHVKRGKFVPTHLHLNVAYVLIADETDHLVINEAENSGVKWIAIQDLHRYSNEPYVIAIYEKIIDWAKRQ